MKMINTITKIVVVFACLSASTFAKTVIAISSKDDFSQDVLGIMTEKDIYKRESSLVQLLEKSTLYQRFIVLTYLVKTEIKTGNYHQANAFAKELLSISEKFKGDWNYGNAIHDANMVLGIVALKRNMVEKAKDYLIAAGQAPTSPQLKNFGPSMMLANALLEIGRTECVITYLELVKKIWKNDKGRLDSWISSIKGGVKPYFGANLNF